MFNAIGLFAGARGLSLGFMQAKKFDVKIAYEFNSTMQETCRKNHPGIAVFGDVRDANFAEIEEKYSDIGVVIGGPPCQGFSNANRQKSRVISQNNSLVKQYIRTISELRPKAFVTENVGMLRSDVHRFYLCEDDLELVESNVIKTANTELALLDTRFMSDEAINIVQSEQEIAQYKWDDFDYLELNVIYKVSKNVTKSKAVLENHRDRLIKVSEKHTNRNEDGFIVSADMVALNAVPDYYAGKAETSQIEALIEPATMYQRMVSKAQEVFEDDIVVDSYTDDKDLIANVRPYAVFGYLKARLKGTSDDDGYAVLADILSATQSRAPQKRMRFIVVGVRKDITDEVKLPEGKFKDGPYRTVADTIENLEDVEPVCNVSDDKDGIKLQARTNLNDLVQTLHDSKILHNYIITKTTPTAMERFKALDQGQNFHSLSNEMKTSTYTDVTRTQNTIHLRLKHDEPSGTVVNVCRSVWVHPTRDRAASTREAAHLQTFPDSFAFCGTKGKQCQQVGNAIPPMVARAIAKKLANQLNKVLSEK